MKIHVCGEVPCPIEEQEHIDQLNAGSSVVYTKDDKPMTPSSKSVSDRVCKECGLKKCDDFAKGFDCGASCCPCQPQQERREVVDFDQVEKNIDKILGDCVCSVDGCKNVILHPSIASVCDEHAMKTQRKCCEEARADERKKVVEEAIKTVNECQVYDVEMGCLFLLVS